MPSRVNLLTLLFTWQPILEIWVEDSKLLANWDGTESKVHQNETKDLPKCRGLLTVPKRPPVEKLLKRVDQLFSYKLKPRVKFHVFLAKNLIINKWVLVLPVAANVCVVNGNSLITVLRPMDEISLNCSLSPIILLHNVSTINSTWWSLTLQTKGPKLKC